MIEIKKSIHDTEDRFCNEIEVQRRNQTSERKNPTHQTENTVTSLNNMLGEAETRISETEDKILELSQLDKEEKKSECLKTAFKTLSSDHTYIPEEFLKVWKQRIHQK